MSRVAVVGAGTMGNGIAHVFAQHGWDTALIDVSDDALARGLATIKKNLERMEKKAAISHQQSAETLGRITTNTSLEAAKDAELVVEAVSENPDVKYKIFTALDRLCPPSTVLASNTSSISITEIAKHTDRPGKVIGMHFMNPVPLMPLVEVVKGIETLINEAILCVQEGIATAEAVDQVMTLGMKHPLGPLALADLIGLDVCLAILNVMVEGFADPKYRPARLLKEMVASGRLGRKSGVGFYVYRN